MLKGAGVKNHVVPASLAKGIMQDLTERGTPLVIQGEAEGFYLDTVGMCHVDRPVMGFAVRGLAVRAVAEVVSLAMSTIASLPVRYTPAGKPYVKHHEQYMCLVMTPAQRDALVAKLSAIVDDAEVAACVFYRNMLPINVVLAEANAKAIGRPVDPKLFGADPHARFRPVSE